MVSLHKEAVKRATQICKERLLGLHALDVPPQLHVGLHDDRQQEVEHQQENDHEVDHIERRNLAAVAPSHLKLSEQQLELCLQSGLKVGVDSVLAPKTPGACRKFSKLRCSAFLG